MNVATGGLAEVRAYLAARDDADPDVAPEMRSTVLDVPGASDVAILLHGLTASPPAWRAIAEDLAGNGIAVVVPRLPLHGHRDRLTPALAGLTARRLIDDVGEIVARVAASGARVTVAGHSLGGLLALHFATHGAPHGASVARAVAIAPFLGAAVVPSAVHRIAWSLVRRLPNVYLWWDPVRRANLQPPHGYPRYPTHALTEALRIADPLVERERVDAEVDLVVNVAESSVNNRTVLRLARAWRARGASVAVHRLQGLEISHDIIDPHRSGSTRARRTIVEIVGGPHAPGERVHRL